MRSPARAASIFVFHFLVSSVCGESSLFSSPTVLQCSGSRGYDRVVWEVRHSKSSWETVFIGKDFSLLPNDSLQIVTLTRDSWFRCTGRVNAWGSILNYPIFVTIPEIPTITSQLQTVDVELGGLLKLFCNATGSPQPEIKWHHNEKRLKDELGIKFVSIPSYDGSSASLEVRNVHESDAGKFYCTASNIAGEVRSQVADVKISSIPSDIGFYGGFSNMTGFVGENLLLQCAANGQSLKYTWLFNGRPLSEDTYEHLSDGNIILRNLNPRLHEGLYQCVIVSKSFSQTASGDSFRVFVVQRPSIESSISDEIVGVERKRIVLPCKSMGRPKPPVQWYLNAKPLQADGVYVEIEDDGSLVLDGLLVSDSGVYQCVLENQYGVAISGTHLSVEKSLISAISIPSPIDVSVVGTGSSSVTVSWRGPKITDIDSYLITFWETNDESGRKRELDTMTTETSHEINRLRDSTLYTFEVRVRKGGKVGEASSQQHRTSRSVRTQRSIIVRPNDFTPTSVKLSWIVNSFSYDLYTVRYSAIGFSPTSDYPDGTQDAGLPIPQQDTTTDTSITLKNLQEDCKYNVTVSAGKAYNDIATGSTVLVTLPAKPSEPPRNIHLMALDPDKIEVRWDDPMKKDQNGILTEYLIKYRPKRQELRQRVNTESTNDISTRQFVIQSADIEKGTDYQVAVAAVNKEGTGSFSAWQDVTTLLMPLTETTRPGKVEGLRVILTDSDSITVQWSGTFNDKSVRVREYYLSIFKFTPTGEYVKVPATVKTFKFEHLSPETQYMVEAMGSNNIGKGEKAILRVGTQSMPTIVDPPLQVPNNVAVTVVDSHTLRVTFSPNNPSKIDISYRVEVTSKFPTVGSRIKECSSSHDCLISELNPGTQYEIKVQAVRRTGDKLSESFWSLSTLCSTDESAPTSAPLSLTANPVPGITSNVILTWITPAESNGVVTGYDLSYTTDVNDREWALDHISGNVLAYEVKDLTIQTTYYFKIAARNNKGVGPESKILSYTTPAVADTPFKGPQQGGAPSEGDAKIYIAIALIVAVTVIVVCLIIAFVVCKVMGSNHAADVANASKMSNAGSRPGSQMVQTLNAYKLNQQQQQQPDLTDFWINKEKQIELQSLNGMPGSETYRTSGYRSASPPDIQKHTVTSISGQFSPSTIGSYSHSNAGQYEPAPGGDTPLSGMAMQMPLPSAVRPMPMRLGTAALAHPNSALNSVHMTHTNPSSDASVKTLSSHGAYSLSGHPVPNPGHPQQVFTSSRGGEFGSRAGSDRDQVYSPASSISGGHQSDGDTRHSSSSTLGHAHMGSGSYPRQDKALKPLPTVPPELKPLNSLSNSRNSQMPQHTVPSGPMHFAGQPVIPSTATRIQAMHQLSTSSTGSSSPVNTVCANPLAAALSGVTGPGAAGVPVPTGGTWSSHDPRYVGGDLQREEDEAGAEIDKIQGLMNRLNSTSGSGPAAAGVPAQMGRQHHRNMSGPGNTQGVHLNQMRGQMDC